MPARALVDARREKFVLMAGRAGGQDEATVAVAAFDEIGVAHLQPHAGMTQGPADTVAGDPPRAHRDDFRGRQIGIGARGGGRLGLVQKSGLFQGRWRA